MTLSMIRAMEILNAEKEDISLNDLLFVLTVFRDNAKDDDVYEFLNKAISNQINS